MDKSVVNKWSSVLKKAIESKEIQDFYNSKALDPYWTDGEAALKDSLNVLETLKKVVVNNNITKKKEIIIN
jgi:tripartite-type tricarboxylate transporter receptor subunit TctC